MMGVVGNALWWGSGARGRPACSGNSFSQACARVECRGLIPPSLSLWSRSFRRPRGVSVDGKSRSRSTPTRHGSDELTLSSSAFLVCLDFDSVFFIPGFLSRRVASLRLCRGCLLLPAPACLRKEVESLFYFLLVFSINPRFRERVAWLLVGLGVIRENDERVREERIEEGERGVWFLVSPVFFFWSTFLFLDSCVYFFLFPRACFFFFCWVSALLFCAIGVSWLACLLACPVPPRPREIGELVSFSRACFQRRVVRSASFCFAPPPRRRNYPLLTPGVFGGEGGRVKEKNKVESRVYECWCRHQPPLRLNLFGRQPGATCNVT